VHIFDMFYNFSRLFRQAFGLSKRVDNDWQWTWRICVCTNHQVFDRELGLEVHHGYSWLHNSSMLCFWRVAATILPFFAKRRVNFRFDF